MELMFRSRGFHPFVTVAIEQEKYLPLTRLPRGEFNLFALLGTDLLHQVRTNSSVGEASCSMSRVDTVEKMPSLKPPSLSLCSCSSLRGSSRVRAC